MRKTSVFSDDEGVQVNLLGFYFSVVCKKQVFLCLRQSVEVCHQRHVVTADQEREKKRSDVCFVTSDSNLQLLRKQVSHFSNTHKLKEKTSDMFRPGRVDQEESEEKRTDSNVSQFPAERKTVEVH